MKYIIPIAIAIGTAAFAGARADEPAGNAPRQTPADETGEIQWSTLSFVTPRGEPVSLKIPSTARSVGKPSNGSLVDGRCIGLEGPGFVHTGKASCATDEVVMLVLFAVGEMLRDYPNSAPVVIGDLSMPDGGPLEPHKSHMSGRDVDIGFFARDNARLRTFGDLDPAKIDFEKSLSLIVNLVATGKVQFIFINYALQPYFVDAARSMGYDPQQIDYLFQYPRGKTADTGIIRHSNGHFRHAHVRFVCAGSDQECTD